MTALEFAATPARMGRKKLWAEDMQARFADGTFARIAAVLQEGEVRMDFVREAVEKELVVRERRLAKSLKAHDADAPANKPNGRSSSAA